MASFGDMAAGAARAERSRHKNKKPQHINQVTDLSQEELKQCKVFFKTFDKDSNQCVDIWELRLALEALGQNPTEAFLEKTMNQLDTNKSGTLEFNEFLKALQMQKRSMRKHDSESAMVEAFVAMGGKPDRTGFINAESLRKVIKDDFGLTIKIDELLDDLDSNNDGFVNFDEFKSLLS